MSEDVAAETRDQKVIYEQRCQDFRSLNGFLWQSPLIIMSLTGGLWFAVASFALSTSARSMLLLFTAIGSGIAACNPAAYFTKTPTTEVGR